MTLPFHDMLETDLVSLDRELKGIQWPLQDEMTADADVLAASSEKKVRQKFVDFIALFMILYASCIFVDYI